MINSICIKTNNNTIINNLLNSIENIDMPDIYLSKNYFKNYENIIVHYRGNTLEEFYSRLAEVLSDTIILCIEKNIIKKNINCNYFYFNDSEKKKIFDLTIKTLSDSEAPEFYNRNQLLFISFLNYIISNKSIVLDGFINFRLKDYMLVIDEAIDYSVNKFLIDREYNEFVDVLKSYINSKKPNVSSVHLIYRNHESILLDESKHVINTDDKIFESKYLSDISFSSNDYALNTLLTLLPKKIYIHLSNSKEDEFINTLKLIFDDKIYLCNDCTICKMYKDMIY